jgi:hypothetical protein
MYWSKQKYMQQAQVICKSYLREVNKRNASFGSHFGSLSILLSYTSFTTDITERILTKFCIVHKVSRRRGVGNQLSAGHMWKWQPFDVACHMM